MNASTLVEKVWNFCRTPRDDGVGYGDYLTIEHLEAALQAFRDVAAGLTEGGL